MIFESFATLLALAASVPPSQSTSSTRMELEVWAPSILSPGVGTVWGRGERYNVRWDASHPPLRITNLFGEVYLVKDGIILLDDQLASGFSLFGGETSVDIPIDIDAGIYQLCLMGDSGNWSNEFTIY